MNKYLIISIFFSIFIMASSHAQDSVLIVNLKEAKTFALEYNKTLKEARKDVLISDEDVKAAWSRGYPQVEGSMNYTTNFNYEFEFGGGGGASEQSQAPDINYAVLDMGDYQILSYLEQMNQPSTIVMEDKVNAQIQVSQLLFSGQYWVGIQTAKIAKKISEHNLQRTELEVKQNVSNIYYMILVTEKLLGIIEKNIDNMQEVLTHTKNMYEAGLAEKTDVDQIKINLSQLKNSKKSMERNISLNYNMFRFQLGLKAGRNIILKDSLPDFINIIEKEGILKSDATIDNNPSYKLVETQVALSKKNLSLQRWAYAPTLSGYYSYTEKLIEAGFDLSPKNAAGVTLSIPIFSGFEKKANVNKAKIQLDKATTSKEKIEEQLQIQEKQLRYELTNAYENYITQKKNVEVAKSVYNTTYDKYKQGLISSLDLTQANSNYLQAENNFISSVMDLLKAKLELKKLYNQL